MSPESIKKILLIEDSGDYRKLLLSYFNDIFPGADITELDPETEKPSDGFPWQDYDLLILDYDLGKGGNGLDWLRHYKTSNIFPATIVLTVHDDEEVVVNALRFGAHGFLRKAGLTPTILLESIESAFKKHLEEKEHSKSGKIYVHFFNKEKFFESLTQVQKNDCVLLIEIDKFRGLQETLGIFETDNFINYVTESVSHFIKDEAYQASMTRIGDSIIALLIHGTSGCESIQELGKNICKLFDNLRYTHNNKPLAITVNTGITWINEKNIELSILLNKVENACYEARKISNNSCSINSYQGDISPAVDQAINDEILLAFNNEQIQLLFQSAVNVSGSNSSKFTELYQARSHLIGPDNNVISAKQFIPVLKQNDLLKRYDRWVIRYSINALTQLEVPEHHKIGVFIALTDESFTDAKLTDWIDKALALSGTLERASSLIFEFNAKRFLEKVRPTKLQVNKLRIRLGASIALSGVDDPDTLERCLSQEKFDYVIFSPEQAGGNGIDQHAIREITSRCQQYKALSVASKISSGEYLAMSATAEVDYVHGHFVQPPMENIIATEKVEM